MTYRVVLRADASTAIGTGHVMRCLTLAEEMIARGWSVTLLAAELPDALVERVRTTGVSIARVNVVPGGKDDAAETASSAANADAVVLDSYKFDEVYRSRIQAVGRPILTLDDGSRLSHLHADLVLNPAAAAVLADYAEAAPGAVLLLGPRFTPVRREIREAAAAADPDAARRARLLILFGGSDPLGLTIPVAALLREYLPEVQVTAVAGAAVDPNISTGGTALLRNPADLPHLIATSGLAVSAAGGTLGELAVCGVPTVAAIVATNQAAAFSLRDWVVSIDARAEDAVQRLAATARDLWCAPDLRSRMGSAARDQVDGCGASRVVAALAARMERNF